MTDEPELSDEARAALRRLAGSLGAIALSEDADELVDCGYAQPIGRGYVITDLGAEALVEPASTTVRDDHSPVVDAGQEERLF